MRGTTKYIGNGGLGLWCLTPLSTIFQPMDTVRKKYIAKNLTRTFFLNYFSQISQ
jgi:hypothetical protein